MNLFANLISILSNPIILAGPLSYSLVLKTSNDPSYSLVWASSALLFTGIIGIFVFFGVRKGIFSDFDVSKREERRPLFILVGVVTLLYMLVVYLLGGPTVLLITAGALILGVLVDSVVNRKIKASVHLAVFSSFSLIIAILYGGFFWILPFFAPLVAWSRITLKKHKLPETIIGSIIGILLVLILYLVLNYFII